MIFFPSWRQGRTSIFPTGHVVFPTNFANQNSPTDMSLNKYASMNSSQLYPDFFLFFFFLSLFQCIFSWIVPKWYLFVLFITHVMRPDHVIIIEYKNKNYFEFRQTMVITDIFNPIIIKSMKVLQFKIVFLTFSYDNILAT